MKNIAMWVIGAAVVAYVVFILPAGKAAVNSVALKIGWGTLEKPLIS